MRGRSLLSAVAAALAIGGGPSRAMAMPSAPPPLENDPTRSATGRRLGRGSRSYGRSYADQIGDAGSRAEVERLLHEVNGLPGAGAKTLRRCRKAAARRLEQLSGATA